jgi:hypothetical protein
MSDMPLATDSLVTSLGTDPWETIEELRLAGQRKARAEGVASQLEHERHVIRSMIQNEIEQRTHEKISEQKLQRLAEADKRYRDHIKGLGAAIEERELAISEYYAIKSQLDWDRAALAHQNVLARLGE